MFVDEGSQATGPTEASTRREGLREHLDEPAQPTAATQVCPTLTNPAKTESHTASKSATGSAESQGLAIFEDNTVNSKPDDCAATASPPTVNTATMHDGEPTMTIDTRAALGEVCGMFSAPLGATTSADSCASSVGGGETGFTIFTD